MTLSALLFLSAILLPSAIQTQNGKAPVTPPAGSATITVPAIKMGLWEGTITNSLATTTIKTRSCITPQTFQYAMANVPPGCTVSNKTQTATSLSGDISCTLQNGGTTTGHLDVQMPDQSTVRSNINLTVNANGRSVPVTMTTESRFVSADCGDIAPGKSKIIQ